MNSDLLESLNREAPNQEAFAAVVPKIEAAEVALNTAKEAEAKEARIAYLAQSEYNGARKKMFAAQDAAVAASLEVDSLAFERCVKISTNLKNAVAVREAGLAFHRQGALLAARRFSLLAELALLNLVGQKHLLEGDIILAHTIRAQAAASEINGGRGFVLDESALVGQGSVVAEHRAAWRAAEDRARIVSAELKTLTLKEDQDQ